jgi:hypothetical protein
MITPRKPPYGGTSVDPDKSRMQIDKLLRDYGVTGIQWRTDYELNQVGLEFSVEAEISGVRKKLVIRIDPPTFLAKRRTWDPKAGRNVEIFAPNWAQSFRLLFYWLKAKLEAIAYGLTSVEKEFLSQVVTLLPGGGTATVGEVAIEAMTKGRVPLLEAQE